ncbi:hypothetical protein RCL1_001501 [Eukaryota sp. TZLM3-RCL]
MTYSQLDLGGGDAVVVSSTLQDFLKSIDDSYQGVQSELDLFSLQLSSKDHLHWGCSYINDLKKKLRNSISNTVFSLNNHFNSSKSLNSDEILSLTNVATKTHDFYQHLLNDLLQNVYKTKVDSIMDVQSNPRLNRVLSPYSQHCSSSSRLDYLSLIAHIAVVQCNLRVFGGFVRDYIVNNEEPSDVDIVFCPHKIGHPLKMIDKFLNLLEEHNIRCSSPNSIFVSDSYGYYSLKNLTNLEKWRGGVLMIHLTLPDGSHCKVDLISKDHPSQFPGFDADVNNLAIDVETGLYWCVSSAVELKLSLTEAVINCINKEYLYFQDVNFTQRLEKMTSKGYKCISPLPSIVSELLDNVKSESDSTFKSFANIANLESVTTLNLRHSNISDISVLKVCNALKSLDLFDNPVDDISSLVGCSNLKKLLLYQTNITSIASLASCPNLVTLGLAMTKISDLSPLTNCKKLVNLFLSTTEITDITPLSNCTSLKVLGLSLTSITNISPLQNCIALKNLNLFDTQVHDISALSCCIDLEQLHLRDTQVADVSPLSHCEKLKKLSLSGTKVVDLSPLSHCTSLELLTLGHTQVSDISPLSKCVKLTELYLNNSKVVDISALEHCVNLKKLRLNNTFISDISSLAHCLLLEQLYINDTLITVLEILNSCVELKKLNVDKVTDSNCSLVNLASRSTGV